jgi:tetratricopeptide (TPR) repeat protein
MNINYKGFITLLFTAFTINFSVASDKGDSLLLVAENPYQTIANRLSAYADLVYLYEVSDPEKAKELGNEGLLLPQVDSLKEKLAYLYVNIAFVYNTAQDYEEAIPYFQKSADVYSDAGNVKNASLQLRNIGVIHRKLGNYSESIKFQLNSLEKAESINDVSGQVACLMNIGNIYIFQKQAKLSIPYYKKAYDIANNFDDELLKAEATNSYALGFDHMLEKDSALFYYLIAIDGYQKLNKWVKKAKTEHNVALIYMNNEDFNKAESMLLSSLDVFNQLPASMAVEKATIQLNLARVYDQTDRSELAIENFKKALEIFREKGVKTEEKSTLEYLSKSLAKRGDYEASLDFLNKFIVLKDSIQNREITTEIAELNEKYESEKKEKEILTLQHKNEQEARLKWFSISISVTIIFILSIIFFIYRQRYIKERLLVKTKLKQNSRELDILRQKIEEGTTQYSTNQEFTLCREDVNSLLKDALSDRELDVFMLLIKGHTNKAIGEKLFVSVNTIKFHLQNIYVKLDVDNRTDAIKSINKKKMTEDVLELT